MRYARIQNGVVVELIDIPAGDNVSSYFHPDFIATLVQCNQDAVEQCWTYNEETGMFAPPSPAEPPPPNLVISPREFRQRFTMDERRMLTLAASKALENGDATLQVFLDDLSSSQVVELNHPEIIEGVQTLVEMGLISKARGDQILKV